MKSEQVQSGLEKRIQPELINLDDQLEVIGDYNYNLQTVLKQVVARIQQQYDLHPKLINHWIHQQKFQQILEMKDRSCYLHFMRQKHPLLGKLLTVTHASRFIEEHLPQEQEKCGHILEEFSNGYIQYCNQHRYQHQTEHQGDFLPNEIDHFFVMKSGTEILDEAIFKLKFNLYLQYTRLLVKTLMDDFQQMIKQSHSLIYVPYTEIEDIIPWLEENNDNFRSKNPSYDRQKNLYLQIFQDRLTSEPIPCRYTRNLPK